jgi:hypothetical protein
MWGTGFGQRGSCIPTPESYGREGSKSTDRSSNRYTGKMMSVPSILAAREIQRESLIAILPVSFA